MTELILRGAERGADRGGAVPGDRRRVERLERRRHRANLDVKRGFAPPHGPGMRLDEDLADVMRQIHDAVEKKAPEIAEPVIKKAEDAGDITGAQADKLRAAAQSIADGKRPDGDVRALLRDQDVRKVVNDAFAAAHKQAPAIAEPIIDKAVDDGKITSAQADDLREKLKSARIIPGGKFGFGHGPGKHHGFGHFGKVDQDVAAVLGDIHEAVEKKAPEIAEPVIEKAEDDGDITGAQADRLRAAGQSIADGKRPNGDLRALLSDQDVRKVVRDAFAAAQKQAPRSPSRSSARPWTTGRSRARRPMTSAPS